MIESAVALADLILCYVARVISFILAAVGVGIAGIKVKVEYGLRQVVNNGFIYLCTA